MTFKEQILNYYNLSDTDYRDLVKPLNELTLPDFNNVKGISKIKERIFSAIKNNEKIVVYGDYDCDGVCSTSIMVKTFEMLNYKVWHYIPTRYNDGYGLNVKNVLKIKENGFKLIIAVDNGICQHEAIDKANELGIDVIVIDHHEVPETPVNAFGIIHPIISEISEIYGCGAFMSLIVSASLLGHYDPYLVTLAGLSTVSDMMVLKGYNRNIVRIALDNLDKNRYKPLVSLMETPVVTERSFSSEIAPRINAIGRLVDDKNINLLVKFLCSQDDEEIFKLAAWINNTNKLKKTLMKEALESLPEDQLDNPDGIVIKLDAKEGLVGIVSNMLLNEKNVPCIVFTYDSNDKNFLKGSARSKDGFSIIKAYDSLKKYLVAGGGHELAGGLTIRTAEFEEFKAEFLKLCKEHKIKDNEKPSIEIKLQDICYENYSILRQFSPFGIGFEEPLFLVRDLPTKSLQFISEGKHISTPISINTKLLGFNMPASYVKSFLKIDVYGNLVISYYRNKESLDFKISDFVTKNI